MDMHSGGRQKEKWVYIYIEAKEDEAIKIFYNRFGHNPHRVTCTCCGNDYSLTESPTLKEATAYERGCPWIHKKGNRFGGGGWYIEANDKIPKGYVTDARINKYRTLAVYKKDKSILIIPAKQIKSSEKEGDVPEQGFVWK